MSSYDYGFNHLSHQFNVDVNMQKTFLKGSLTTILFANDIFRSLHNRWGGFFPTATVAKDAYNYTQSIGVSFIFKLKTTRSNYKGTGAGNAEKNRL